MTSWYLIPLYNIDLGTINKPYLSTSKVPNKKPQHSRGPILSCHLLIYLIEPNSMHFAHGRTHHSLTENKLTRLMKESYITRECIQAFLKPKDSYQPTTKYLPYLRHKYSIEYSTTNEYINHPLGHNKGILSSLAFY